MTLFLSNLSLKCPLKQGCLLLLLFSQSLVFAQGIAEPKEVVASESVVASSLREPSVQTVQDVDRSLSVLSDREIRVKLRQTLIENLAETSVVSTETWSEKVKTGLLNTVQALHDSVIKIAVLGDAFRQLHSILLSNIENGSSILTFFLMVISSLLLGFIIEWGLYLLVMKNLVRGVAKETEVAPGKFVALAKIAIRRLFLLSLFYWLSFGALDMFCRGAVERLTAQAILDYVLIARLSFISCAFFFAPQHPQLRLFNVSDVLSEKLVQRMVIVSLFAASSIFIEWSRDMGLAQGEYKLGFWTNLLFYISMIVAVYLSREGIRQMLLHKNEKGGVEHNHKQRLYFAKHWSKLVITCIALVWIALEVVIANKGFDDDIVYAATFTMLTIVALPFFDVVIITWALSHYPASKEETKQRYLLSLSLQHSLIRIARVSLLSIFMLLFSMMWGLNYFDLATQGPLAQVLARFIEAVVLLLCGYIIWELLNSYIQRKLARETADISDEPSDSEGGQGLSRTATLLPLIRNTLAFFIFILSILGALSTLGINTTALLAGAGVLGLAIGFGAQTLVKDIVSGVFFLVDDAFRMGEYVIIGSTMGTVEKIALRSLRLRHHLGALHTIPYGEIPSLTNYSRDWVIMKLRFRVPHDTDIYKVKKLFKSLGQELLQHPELGEGFLEPFKSQGVLEVDEVGMLIRGKFTCKPGAQFMIRKHVYLRVQQIFAENNIEFAKRRVEVQIPKDLPDRLSGPVSAAASESINSPVIPAVNTV